MGVLSDRQIEQEVKITPRPPKISPPGVLSYGLSSYGCDLRCGYRFKVFSPATVAQGVTEIDPKNFDHGSLMDVDLTPHECEWRFALVNTNGQKVYQCLRCDRTSMTPNAKHSPPIPNFIRIPAHSYVLAETIERIEVPRDTLALVLGKSTYARCGIVTPLTPLEPEWRGKVTVEISNQNPLPARVYAGEGIFQVIFLRSDDKREGLVKIIEDIIGVGPSQYRVGLGRQLKHRTGAMATCETSYADRKGRYQDQPGLTLPTVNKE